jgi:hypothetical protein
MAAVWQLGNKSGEWRVRAEALSVTKMLIDVAGTEIRKTPCSFFRFNVIRTQMLWINKQYFRERT